MDAETPAIILLYPGVSAYEATGALAAFHAAGLAAETASSEAMVASLEGARLVPHRLGFQSFDASPVVILPGGDVANPLRDAGLARALRARRGRHVLAAGEGVRVAAHAGLTEGRRVARLPGDAPIPGAEPAASRLVVDGRLATCFAGDALVDLALHFVAHEHGAATAERAAARLGREFRPFAFGTRQA